MSPQFGGENFILRVDVVDCAPTSGRPSSILHRTEVCVGNLRFLYVQFMHGTFVPNAQSALMPMAVWRWLGIAHLVSEPKEIDLCLARPTTTD